MRNKIIIVLIISMFLLTCFAATPSLSCIITSGTNTAGVNNNQKISLNNEKNLQLALADDIPSIIQQIDEELILGYLEDIVSFGPRYTGTESCEQAAEYIYNEFESMGLAVRYTNGSNANWDVKNIEATLPGIDAASDKIYIICAHYDTNYMSQGADDDGSGVAAVLAAAKVMSQYSFNSTIRFITFGGEEQIMVGSTRYAKEAKANGDNIIAVLNADMIGYATGNWWKKETKYVDIWYNNESEWLANFTYNVSTYYYKQINIKVNKAGYSQSSDHASFWSEGFDAIQYKHIGRNSYPDTIDYINIPYNTKIAKLITASLAALANDINVPKKETTFTKSTNIKQVLLSVLLFKEDIIRMILMNKASISPN